MLHDLLIAIPVFIAVFALLWLPDSNRRLLLPGLIILLSVASLWSFAFDGYSSDLWAYLTVSERVASGHWLLDREAFRLEPPAGPHHSILWIITGLITRFTGLSPLLQFRGLGILTIMGLAAAAWRLATRAFCETPARLLAVSLFIGSLSGLWATIELNRNVVIIFVLLAVAETLNPEPARKTPWRWGLWVAIAFWIHFFGGLLALAGAGLGWLISGARRDGYQGFALALSLSSPVLWHYLAQSAHPVTPAYLWGPGQIQWAGLRWFNPAQLLREIPPALLLAGIAGMFIRPARETMPVHIRKLCFAGCAINGLVLLTPLYHLWCGYLGGWLAVRLTPLMFLWIPATATISWAFEQNRKLLKFTVVTLAAAVFWQGAARTVRDSAHGNLHYRFTPEAQAEARSLRGKLDEGLYLTPDDLGYGLAGLTLGRPFTVTPGRGSPYHPWASRSKEALNVLNTNSEPCWTEFLSSNPEVRYLVTPGSSGHYENHIWDSLVPRARPGDVRAALARMGATETVHQGNYFVIDRIRMASGQGGVSGKSCGE